MCKFVGMYVCLDLLIYIEISMCVNIKREEMNLYLKRGVHMCRCMLAKKGMCYKDVCVCVCVCVCVN
jgi:hypothetical protein